MSGRTTTDRLTANVRVRVTVEVNTGAWGGDCTLDQVKRQAVESGIAEVQAMVDRYSRSGIRLVAAQVAGVVLVPEEP